MKRVRVLLVDDDDLFRKSLAKELVRSKLQVRTAADGRQALDEVRSSPPDVVLLDIRLPGRDGLHVLRSIKRFDPSIEVIMLTAFGEIDTAVASLQAGAHHYLVKPAPLAEIDAAIQRAYEKRCLSLENLALKERLRKDPARDTIVGDSPPMLELLALAEKVAASDRTVLLEGESGTGKELIARHIHRESRRRERPFVLVDCASLSKSLLESELFGYEKGAFTGAEAARPGLLESAHTGTLFVDEVGVLDPGIQASFLRLMETHEYRRVGATETREADLRVIAATNAHLDEAVRDGKFREDLFYRLSVIVLRVPPLRARTSDIPLLAEHFLQRTGFDATPKKLSPAALRELTGYGWPGNVRELRNCIERAALLSDGEVIEPWDLELLASPSERILRRVSSEDRLVPLREVHSRYIHLVLNRVHGNQQEAARILGIDPKTIYRHLKKENQH